jgi:hypothetical protein
MIRFAFTSNIPNLATLSLLQFVLRHEGKFLPYWKVVAMSTSYNLQLHVIDMLYEKKLTLN